MPGFLDELLGDYQRALLRHRNRPFLEAAMAACALASVADGAPSLSERIRVDRVLETLDELDVFDPHEGVALFDRFSADILAAPRAGRERALARIEPHTADRDRAQVLVRICLAVAEAGGDTTLVQQIEIVTLCSLLGVEPDFAGFYTDDA